MSTLSPIDPKSTFHDLETLVNDATNAVDALNHLIYQQFAENAPEGGHVVSVEDANRMFFLSGLATNMSDKVRDAYYVAWENSPGRRSTGGAK